MAHGDFHDCVHVFVDSSHRGASDPGSVLVGVPSHVDTVDWIHRVLHCQA